MGARCALGAVFRLTANTAATALTGLAGVGGVGEALPIIIALVVEETARAFQTALALYRVGAGRWWACRLLANHVAIHTTTCAAAVAGVRKLLTVAALHSLVVTVCALGAAVALNGVTAQRSGTLLGEA